MQIVQCLEKFCSDDNRNGRLPRVKCFQIFFITLGLVCLICDQIIDIFICLSFWRDGRMLFFKITLVLYLLPSLIILLMSIITYRSYSKNMNDNFENEMKLADIPPDNSFWGRNCRKGNVFCMIIFHFGNLSLIWRYVEILYLYMKNKYLQNSTQGFDKNNEKLEIFLANFYTSARDTFFLRFLEAYLECGPQLLLRLYMLAKGIQIETGFPDVMLYAAMIFSWISMAWSSANYERWRLYCMMDAKHMNLKNTVFYFFFYAFTVGSTVFSMAMFASISENLFFICCGIHWFVMTAFIFFVRVISKWSFEELEENLFVSTVLGFTYLFCYIDAREGPAWWLRYRSDHYKSFSAPCFLIYYSIIYMETIALIIWICTNYNAVPVLVFDASIVALLICAFFAVGAMLKIVIHIQVDPAVTQRQIC